ncbi:glycyl radical protein [Chloroflexota bacterium]
MVTETMETTAKRQPTERVKRLKEEFLKAEPRLSCERLYHLRDFWKETEGEPLPIRRAKFFAKHLSERTIIIDENPIAGTLTEHSFGFQAYPEFYCEWMEQESGIFTHLGEAKLKEEEIKILKETVAYWRDKCSGFKIRETAREKYGGPIIEELTQAALFSNSDQHYLARNNPDFGKVLNKGLEGIIVEIDAELSKLAFGDLEDYQKEVFLKGMKIACNAVIKFALRYAALAKEMAGKETDPKRKKELERTAAACARVPAKPARTFYEALQSFWFTHLATHIEATSSGRSPGRFARYMYPFYQKDKAAGKITTEEVIELLDLLFLKFSSVVAFQPRRRFRENMGNMFQNIAVGGITETGEDATNEMDYLLLEAQYRVHLLQPTLSVLYHDKLPQDFLLKCVELIRTGIGMPAFFSNEQIMSGLLTIGVSLEDARNCALVGCIEGTAAQNTAPEQGSVINMPKLLEWALYNGFDPHSGKRLGLKTGDAEKFKTYEELHEAIRKQVAHFVAMQQEYCNMATVIKLDSAPMVFESALINDCIKNGKDSNGGGARYRRDGQNPIGIVDFADALAVIKKLVFEEKTVTMKELLAALKANFKGYEELRKKMLEVPKYGNNDDYVDRIAKEWYGTYYDEHQQYRDHMGAVLQPCIASVTRHFTMGVATSALPNGREAWVPFADGAVSAEPGKDIKGPTALVLSATNVIDNTKYAASLFNMKFTPSVLKTREGQRKLLNLVKTFMDLGGYHIQFNVVGAETLRDAQLHPEKYRNLIVRVAGFSAFYIHLEEYVQNEIIKRTELNLA